MAELTFDFEFKGVWHKYPYETPPECFHRYMVLVILDSGELRAMECVWLTDKFTEVDNETVIAWAERIRLKKKETPGVYNITVTLLKNGIEVNDEDNPPKVKDSYGLNYIFKPGDIVQLNGEKLRVCKRLKKKDCSECILDNFTAEAEADARQYLCIFTLCSCYYRTDNMDICFKKEEE